MFFKKTPRRKKSRKKISWQEADDIKLRIKYILRHVDLPWVKVSQIVCFRSENAKTRAYARIWGLGRVWQLALKLEAVYVIEVIAEKFDKLPQLEQDKVLLHELAHIPKNFSGSLVPHIRSGKRNFHGMVDALVSQYLNSR